MPNNYLLICSEQLATDIELMCQSIISERERDKKLFYPLGTSRSLSERQLKVL